MTTNNYVLSGTENWYRDRFQGLWNNASYRVEQLHRSYDLLKYDDEKALNTTQAENIARELAQTESQKANFYSNLAAGLQRRENVLRTQLSNSVSELSKSQIQAQLDDLNAARVGLSCACGDMATALVVNVHKEAHVIRRELPKAYCESYMS